MTTIREACDEEEKIAPVAILKQTAKALLQEAIAIDCEMQRLAVRHHYHMQKINICLHNLERHCELH